MGDTSRSQTISTKLQGIAEQAVRYPEMVFTTLAHHINPELLRRAYELTRKGGSPGLDGVTGKDYAVNLESNLKSLHERLKSGKYRAPLIKRSWIEKEDGKKRPLGITEFEDKVVQRSGTMLLEAVYEQDFHEFSYGFRKGRSPHDGIGELREQIMSGNIRWIVDADIKGYFDNIDHGLLMQVIKQRVNDGGLLRLIGKWLKAGVVDGGSITYPEKGTPQGGVISPMLSNIFLHHVLDEWYVKEVKPRMKGRTFLIRFADDYVISCELEEDARTLMRVLPKRFQRFGLELHPEKTQLIEYKYPGRNRKGEAGKGTFDFLGFTFYWAKSRRGYWVVKKRTSGKRLRRTMKSLWEWCRENRHEPVWEQHLAMCQKLRGHFQYFGVICNYRKLESYYEYAKRTWRYWLSQRGERKYISWKKYEKLLEKFPLPIPRIVHNV
jgi:group II intron reverse transcriptase/maturase